MVILKFSIVSILENDIGRLAQNNTHRILILIEQNHVEERPPHMDWFTIYEKRSQNPLSNWILL
jgi:hypothetical protein